MGLPGRRLLYTCCALGFLAALAGFRAQWRLAALPPAFPAARLAFPVVVEGLPAAGADQLRFLVESWLPGDRVRITDAAGETHAAELVPARTALPVAGISGAIFMAFAVFFCAPRRARPGAAHLFWIAYLYGASILIGGVYFSRDGPWPMAGLALAQMTCLVGLPLLFLHLALSFPTRAALLDRTPRLVPSLTVAAAAVVSAEFVAYLRYLDVPVSARAATLTAAGHVSDVFLVVTGVAGVVVLVIRSRRLELARERAQARWLLWGIAVGATPYVFLRTLPTLFGATPPLPESVDRLVELVIPFAFAMAVVRHRLLDVDVIIRRSLLYGVLAAALIALYLAAVVAGTDRFAPSGLDPRAGLLVVGLVAGAAFAPLRRLIGVWIDRRFFRLAHDHDVKLAALQEELAAAIDARTLADSVQRQVGAVFAARPSCVVIGDPPRRPAAAGDLAPDEAWQLLTAVVADGGSPSLVAVPRTTARPELERDDLPAAWAIAGVRLVQPIAVSGTVAGGILLGPRDTGRRYVEQDLDFLAGCARVAGACAERIRMLQAIADEAAARRRLDELNRLKSEFLSRVAHDLRTPVAGIAWSAQNLLEGVVGELDADQGDYVRSIAQSGAYLNRLVDNLLEISRLELGRAALSLEDVDPAAAWQEAAALVAPFAAAQHVALRLTPPARPARVRADAGKLLEVAVNLLDNAIKYTAPDTAVEVVVHEPAPDAVDVSVRDHGPGLGGQDLDELCERYAQGAPSPHSSRRGFGLGLTIAVAYLERMGGALSATDAPDGGAVFTCRCARAVGPGETVHEGIGADRR